MTLTRLLVFVQIVILTFSISAFFLTQDVESLHDKFDTTLADEGATTMQNTMAASHGMTHSHKCHMKKTHSQHADSLSAVLSQASSAPVIKAGHHHHASSPVLGVPSPNAEWVLQADYVDACSCDMACPCLFGGSSTHGYCKGASLMEIKQGRYGQVDLAGVTVLAVYNSGQWIKYFVSEHASKEQTNAIVKFLPEAEGFFEAPVREVKNVPISVNRTEDKVKITTEGTLVELEQIKNAAGDPIKVLGLPARGFPGLPLSRSYAV